MAGAGRASDATAELLAGARATLARGRLAAARQQFREIAALAQQRDDVVARAEAAIGGGGVWLYELRVVDERAAYLSLARDALAGLGDSRPDLQLRLRARLAAEATYDGTGTVGELRAIVDDVRRTGDRVGLAECLSLLHHAMLTPADAHDRLAVAEELIAVAAANDDRVLGVMGLLWRAVDLFLLGHPGAERALGDLRLRAEQSGFLVARHVVAAMDTMLLMRAGRLDEAEQAADECHRLGTEAGDADADGWYMAQLLAIRWMRGTAGELLAFVDDVARGTTLVFTFAAYIWTGVALVAVEAGDLDAARAALDRVLVDELRSLPPTSAFLPAMFGVAETAAALGDVHAAAEVAEIVEPYRTLPMMGSLAILCFGSTARTIGVARHTAGDSDGAIKALEDALLQNRRLGHLPMVAITRVNLADALAARGIDDDRARAEELLDQAIASGEALGLDARAAAWSARRAALTTVTPDIGKVCRRSGWWEIQTAREFVVVSDSVGMQYLAELLSNPFRDRSATDLAGSVHDGRAQPILDDHARRAYQRRAADLQHEIDDADGDADIERAARFRAELDALVDEVTRMVKPGGRSRTFVDSSERARISVQKALRRAIAGIAAEAPVLGEALSRSVRTGSHCRFDPVAELPQQWEVATG